MNREQLMQLNDIARRIAQREEFTTMDGTPLGMCTAVVSPATLAEAGLVPDDVPHLHVVDPDTGMRYTLGAERELLIPEATAVLVDEVEAFLAEEVAS